MAHFLIADDEERVRDSIAMLLKAQQHSYKEAGTILDILKVVQNSEKIGEEPFDLILLDYDFGGSTGVDAITYIRKMMGAEYCEHRFVIITGCSYKGLATEFASLGAINHLLKPISQQQFYATLESATTRREIYVDKKDDWEYAIELLENLGILDDVKTLEKISKQHEELQYIHNALLKDIVKSKDLENIAKAYSSASESLNKTLGSFETIFTLLKEHGFTNSFVDDIKYIHDKDRLYFLSLQSYIARINNPHFSCPVKHLSPGAPNHYEFHVGKSYRLYFRNSLDKGIVFERFGHKNVQNKIIRFLSGSTESDISDYYSPTVIKI